MVDLVSQYNRLQTEIEAALLGAVRSGRYIGGAEVNSFKQELQDYLGVKHVIPCANGTDALQIAMMALDLKPGDEVITPAFTFIATAEVIGLLGLTPVLVDVDPETFTLDLDQVESAISDKTKAIVPVHLYGQCADMDALNALADKHGIHLIEDTAQAIGSDYSHADGSKSKAGTMGIVGTTSFFPSKNLGCFGDGGAIFSNDDEVAKKCQMICNHGSSTQYVHEVIGVNSRLDSIQAAILRVKLRHLDDFATRRRVVADRYDNAFASTDKITTPFRHSRSQHVFHQYTMKLHGLDRDGMRAFLAEHDIPSMVYYPIPLHNQKAFSDARFDASQLTVTDDLCTRVISLPIHTEMENVQQDRIIEKVLEYANR